MQLGAVPPTEVLFAVSLTPGTATQKLEKDAPPTPNNFLSDEARKKPFRNYSILYRVDGSTLRFTTTPEGLHHSELEFVALVYDDQGAIVNSIVTVRKIDLPDAAYKQSVQSGLGIKQLIAVPVKGSYFFRFGVHDAVADRSGVTEIPVDNVQLGVVGPGQQPVP
jgi:hypothetical protein